ncbi:hypothetical protein BHM03_00037087 [Ensete ventricosum]|nr:hypothetical protein BHM03_00037087 [Ensete ventricosum]
MELQPDNEPKLSLGIGPGSDDAVGPRREFARRFTEGIRKLTGNTLGYCRKKTRRLTARMSEAVGLVGVLSTVDSPKPMPKPPIPRFYEYV